MNSDNFIISVQSLRLVSDTVQSAAQTGLHSFERNFGLTNSGTTFGNGTNEGHSGASISFDSNITGAINSHHELIALVHNHGAIDPSGMLFT